MIRLLLAEPTSDMVELPSWMVTGAGPGRLKLTCCVPACWFDSVMAARSVQRASESAHTPSPGTASGVSAALVTVNVKLVAGARFTPLEADAAADGADLMGAPEAVELTLEPCAAPIS